MVSRTTPVDREGSGTAQMEKLSYDAFATEALDNWEFWSWNVPAELFQLRQGDQDFAPLTMTSRRVDVNLGETASSSQGQFLRRDPTMPSEASTAGTSVPWSQERSGWCTTTSSAGALPLTVWGNTATH